MTEYAQCPHCGVDLDYCDLSNYTYHEMFYLAYWTARCLKCQRTYKFVDVYKLTERKFFNEEDAD